MKSYEINKDTMAVIPENNKSRVYEVDDNFLIDQSSLKVMEESCEYFGSTLEGRQRATSKITGITHKVPVIVEESKKIIFFPTMSPRIKECAWLSLKYVDKYYKVGDNVCIEFRNGRKILLPISYYTIDNQIMRSARLDSMLNDRLENDKKPFK